MSRKAIHIILPCLLCMLPVLLCAQSLTRLEYWFDDDFADRRSISLSGSDATVEKSLSTDGLDNGVHKICFRSLRSDGKYTAISSSLFFKQYSDSGETFEYWLDDDYEGRVRMNIANTEDEQELTFDLSDEQLCPFGFHQLHFRVAQAGKGMSATYTTGIWKRQLGTATQLEYWFDNDIENSKILDGKLASSGDAYIFNTDIDMSALSVGVHLLNYRPCDSKTQLVGMVQSTTIMKVPSGIASQVEYWFDDDMANSKILTGHLSSDEGGYIINADLDVSQLSVGMHRLNYRACDKENNLYGAIISSPVLKVPSGIASHVEYWFDDDIENSKILDGKLASSGDAYVFNNEIDAGSLSMGMHRLNYRACDKENNLYGAVISSPIIKLSAGTATKLEYWIDNDRSNVHTINGELTSDGKDYKFVTDLDLGDVSAGHHRLYCRAVSNSKRTVTAVTMTPIIVKSRYNVENTEDVTMTHYSIAVDDEEPLILDVPSPKEVTTIPYTLDARRFSAGNHTLTATFWNSLGLNVTDQSSFAVVEQKTPTVTLSATEEDGYVKLSFNSIPNDVHYIVGRKDANGKARKVFETYNSNYPNNMNVVDHPVAGNYTYYVRAVYTDIDENKHGISSNEIPLTIETQNEATSKGCIVGRVIFDEQEIDLISAIRMIYAEFSDGDEKARIKPNGTFYRDGIPLGTKLTISIPDDDYYTYESVALEVTENTRNEVQIIKATRRKDNTVQVSNTDHDLVITSLRVKESPNGFDIQVQNISGHTWRGHIKLIAVRTEDLEKEQSSSKSVFQLSAFKTYYDAGSTYINYLPNGEAQPVNIKITGIPASEDGDTYSFFIISNENGEENILKLLDCSNTISITNPLKQWIKGEEEFNYYGYRNELMFKEGVAEILSMMKQIDKGVGPFTFALNEIEDDLRQYEITHDSEGFFGNLPDILKFFSVDLKNAVDDVKEFTNILGSAKKFYDYVKTFEIFNGDDYTAKYTKLCQIVMDWAFDGNPFAKIYSQYFEAVEHAYNTANSWSKHFNDLTLGRKFDDHEVSIIVEVDGYWGNLLNSFSAKDVQQKIVKAELHMRQNNNWSHRVYTPKVSGTDVFLKFAYDIPSNHQEFLVDVPIDEFYMDVFWEGDLMTTVWLLNDTKVKYDLGTYRVKFKSSAVWAHNMLEGLHWQPKDE